MFALLLTITTAPPLEVGPPPRLFDPFAKWEKNIVVIEKRLAAESPKPGGVFFVGSSSIVQWDFNKWFPGRVCERRLRRLGHRGQHALRVADRDAFKPATIVFYAGDNDIAAGRKAAEVDADFRAFVAAVRKDNPACRVLYLPVKPSVARWKKFDEQTKANALVRAFCEKESGLVYVDIVAPMLRADGTPDPDLFVKDGLHMTTKGYEIWTAAVAKALK